MHFSSVKSRAGAFCLISLLTLSTGLTANAQCRYNQDMGDEGTDFANIADALAAAKRTYFGPSGVFATNPATYCSYRVYTSVELSFIPGGGSGTIQLEYVGLIQLAEFSSDTYVLVANRKGYHTGSRCDVVGTFEETTAPGYTLRCSAPAPITTLTLSGPTETRPAGTGGNSTVALTAKTTAQSAPKAGVAIDFTVSTQPNSGGHDHDSISRPKGTLSVAQGTTNANGEVAISFSAPEVAGIHTIKATCPSCANTAVSQDVQVKVPDLLPISPNPPQNADGNFAYALTSVDKTHQGNGRYHHNQYYLTQQSHINLQSMIEAFAENGWGTVALNDASLFWGGRYDITSNWGAPHAGHREGREIDISFSRAGNPISKSKQKIFFDKFCKNKKVSFPFSILHHYIVNPHFHMYLEKQAACWKSEK